MKKSIYGVNVHHTVTYVGSMAIEAASEEEAEEKAREFYGSGSDEAKEWREEYSASPFRFGTGRIPEPAFKATRARGV
jgi:hypothetical protein